ncbi:MAG: hypothetical protein ABI416_03070 [Ginsengibacter sp.]
MSIKNSGIGCYSLKENSFFAIFVAYWNRQEYFVFAITDTETGYPELNDPNKKGLGSLFPDNFSCGKSK